mgnify:CR=1 FL=1
MRKLLGFVAVALLAGGVSFAGDFYNGDVQIQVGAGFDSTECASLNSNISATVFDFCLVCRHCIQLLAVKFENHVVFIF